VLTRRQVLLMLPGFKMGDLFGTPISADELLLDGVWTWFNDPRAISVNGQPLIGAVDADGDLVAFDVASGTSQIDLHGSTFEVDDHNNPAFLIRASDSRILAFASLHAGANIYKYLSTNPNDASAWGAAVNLDASFGLGAYSYVNPYQLTDIANDPIYLFTRAQSGGVAHFYYSVSTDSGSTFGALTKVFSNNGDETDFSPYVKIVQNGNGRLDLFLTDGHPDSTPTNSIYHCYFDGTSFRDTAGNALVLPIDPAADLTKVYDGATNPGWVWDCAIAEDGHPALLYTAHNSTTDHRYRFAKWNGASWVGGEIATAGSHLLVAQPYYSGGAAIDPANLARVFLSREVNGVHQIWRYVTSDFSTWTGEQITKGKRSFRPYVVRGQVAEPRLVFVEGNYDDYFSYATDIRLKDSRAAAVTLSTDAQYASASLIVPFDGPSGGTAATDFSANAHVMTFRGDAVLSAARTKWGVSSLRLNGDTDGAVTIPNSATFQFGLVDFAVELWASADDWTPAAVNRFLLTLWRNDVAQRSWAIDLTTAGLLRFLGTTDGTTTTTLLSYDASGLVVNQFYHIAVTRVSGTFKLWVDGVEVNSNAVAFDLHAGTGTLTFGNNQNGAATWNTTNVWVGNVDGCRITKANRAIVLPTEQFPIAA
jgi:hypothetical protein